MPRSKERLDKLLLERGLAPTRAKAQAMIMAGLVRIDGTPAEKAGQLVSPDLTLEIVEKETEWVSRGAKKLLKALEVFGIDPSGRVCLDVGASTGGFTEVLLSRNASRVYAVDVGYGQLAWKIRTDPRVVVMERTNARYLNRESFPTPMDLIVVDVSFISLRLLLPPLLDILKPDGEMAVLVKPQFEAGKDRVGKGGVVRSSQVHREVLEEFVDFVRGLPGITLAGLTWSPIKGPSGNIEFLAHLSRIPRGGEFSGSMKEMVETVVFQAALALSGNPDRAGKEKGIDT
ncbi:MAG: TlyA family RNA methyltransferase [Synergistaceae bacterium]|nr:TlyA family RNA methyltransferase [Synergistaceae bacterium]